MTQNIITTASPKRSIVRSGGDRGCVVVLFVNDQPILKKIIEKGDKVMTWPN
jgi:hypothetical protein